MARGSHSSPQRTGRGKSKKSQNKNLKRILANSKVLQQL
jgi:hypothetical protein